MTQNERVKRYLLTHPEGLDAPTAFEELGIYRLSSCIKRLRDGGMNIMTIKTLDRERFALYRIVREPSEQALRGEEMKEEGKA